MIIKRQQSGPLISRPHLQFFRQGKQFPDEAIYLELLTTQFGLVLPQTQIGKALDKYSDRCGSHFCNIHGLRAL